jgi:hypothetical protein
MTRHGIKRRDWEHRLRFKVLDLCGASNEVIDAVVEDALATYPMTKPDWTWIMPEWAAWDSMTLAWESWDDEGGCGDPNCEVCAALAQAGEDIDNGGAAHAAAEKKE